MLRTSALPSAANQVVDEKAAACPCQRLRRSSISRPLPLAVAHASLETSERFRCTRLPLQPTHLRSRQGSQRSQITCAHFVPSGEKQTSYGYAKRQRKSTACQASRASMSDSLEEVRQFQSLYYFTISQISSFCCCEHRWGFVTAL